MWYLAGLDSTEWISNYSSFWSKISDDGKTANSAYGARIFKQNPKIASGRLNQWEYIKEELRRDPDSRRAVILIRTPDDAVDAKLDMPCTLSLQFFIRDNKLSLVSTMRSNDVILGLANDVPAFCLFQELMAFELGVELGSYIHTSNSMHVYDRHFPMCQRIKLTEPSLKEQWSVPALPPIRSAPPIEQLVRLEELTRSVLTVKGIEHLKNSAFDSLMQGADDYWRDWGLILLAHRAGKLGSEDFKQNILGSTTFEGYRRFSK